MRMRRSMPLRLEIMEERVLLSSGIADPAANAPVEATRTAKSFAFNGKLYVGFTAHLNRLTRESFFNSVNTNHQSFPPMGKNVSGFGNLAHPGYPGADGLPNLSDTELGLSNTKGSLIVTFSSSTTATYGFTISGGTKQFVRADGTTGTAVLTSPPRGVFTLTFRTDKHAT
jgi:hypothetical protein